MPKWTILLLDTLKECYAVITELDITDDQVHDECVEHLGEFLQDNSYLEALGLCYNHITVKGIETLSDCLVGNTKLREIYLGNSENIADASIPHLIIMAKKTCLTKIDLQSTSTSQDM